MMDQFVVWVVLFVALVFTRKKEYDESDSLNVNVSGAAGPSLQNPARIWWPHSVTAVNKAIKEKKPKI